MSGRWTLALLALAAVSCSEQGASIGFAGTPVDPGFCRAEVDASFVQVDGAGSFEVITLDNPCGQLLVLDVYLDDPDGAFQLDQDGVFELEADDSMSVQVELVADQPGTYEAQLFIDLMDFNDGTVVEVIGTVQADEG